MAVIAMAVTAMPATAQMKSKAGKEIENDRAAKVAELPVCARPIGTLALSEPENTNRWWTELGLSSPEALIRVYVQKSKCFRLVNRSNRGMAAMQQERALAAGGETRRGGSFGKGQMVEADFTVIPDIVTSNNNKGGLNIGGLVGGFLPGGFGALASGISIKKKSANVILNVVNNKSSEEFVAEGQSKKSDLGWGGGGGLFSGGFLGAGGASGYDNTEIGQVVALAYLDAYTKLVNDLGGMSEAIAGPQAERAVAMKNAGRMFTGPATNTKVLKPLDAGAMLYPTGKKQGGFWEVEDELGSKGWVSEVALAVAR
ncbi:CsgG/HfaB family protein [Polymorphobacter fuscus]|uniref:CsgG/HfaB family protein n=1 Tax=Sandarakinorhabdus fusca TaxID=1439888 RepID=UPI001699068B|nr:CsgG/HfaB family protein [Polymorphobacter fuscus]NJC08861.1 curli biogenesis system outer membrane secretion channel CsgG [Polymorphobacter fuscus]